MLVRFWMHENIIDSGTWLHSFSMADLYYIWSERPIFDAALIRCPTLVIRSDLDFFADPGFASRISKAAFVREVVINGATHWAPFEQKRQELFDLTAGFLQAEVTRKGI